MGLFEKLDFGFTITEGKLRGWGCLKIFEFLFTISAEQLKGWGVWIN